MKHFSTLVSSALSFLSRSRTVNLHQTLEPLTNKARHTLGLPSTLVNNRDEATLDVSLVVGDSVCHILGVG